MDPQPGTVSDIRKLNELRIGATPPAMVSPAAGAAEGLPFSLGRKPVLMRGVPRCKPRRILTGVSRCYGTDWRIGVFLRRHILVRCLVVRPKYFEFTIRDLCSLDIQEPHALGTRQRLGSESTLKQRYRDELGSGWGYEGVLWLDSWLSRCRPGLPTDRLLRRGLWQRTREYRPRARAVAAAAAWQRKKNNHCRGKKEPHSISPLAWSLATPEGADLTGGADRCVPGTSGETTAIPLMPTAGEMRGRSSPTAVLGPVP